MRNWHTIALFVCAALTAGVIWQRQQMHTSSMPIATAANSTSSEPVDALAAEVIAESTRELARLRSEVTHLRARKSELQSVRSENAALLKAATNTSLAVPPEAPPGFVSRDKLSNVGYANPDDALQTLFWAMREGNYAAMMHSYTQESPERRNYEQMALEKRAALERNLAEDTEALRSHLHNVGVHAREVISDDAIILHVGSSYSTNSFKMRVERTPEGWKFSE